MPYTFDTLDGFDFELLVRDLLQAEWGLTLESFARGRDGGIDLRYACDTAHTRIIQCKQYSGSGYAQLVAEVKKEASKVKKLKPNRYFLATSVRMTSERKEDLQEILKPCCKWPTDIFGPEDLNNLLGKFPAVEQRHYKLWLSSTVVMQRVLNAGVLGDSERSLADIQRRVRRYVDNGSLKAAEEMLEEYHFCIISGIPGIGKTTLAEMLAMCYVNLEYAFVRVRSMDDARRVFDTHAKQFLLFDDFLGESFLDRRTRREAAELVELLEQVRRSPHHRFVLTTREHILKTANQKSERLKQSYIHRVRHVIDLKQYTERVRAQILYNHLRHATSLPQAIKDRFAEKQVYGPIIHHDNFSPRIIEQMTRFLAYDEDMSPDEYIASFMRNLQNPTEVWHGAFNEELDDAARNLLKVMVTLPTTVRIADLRKAFEAFHRAQVHKYHYKSHASEFGDAMDALAGSFLKVTGDMVSFFNGSVRDFMKELIQTGTLDPVDLLDAAVFAEQVAPVFAILDESTTECTADVVRSALRAVQRTLDGAQLKLGRYAKDIGDWYELALDVWSRLPVNEVRSAMDQLTQDFIQMLPKNRIGRVELESILSLALTGDEPYEVEGGPLHLALIHAIVDCSDYQEIDLDDLYVIADAVNKHGDYITEDQLEPLRFLFEQHAAHELDAISELEDPEEGSDRLSDLDHMAEALDVDLGDRRNEVEELIGMLDPIQDEVDEKDEGRDLSTEYHDQGDTDYIQELFQKLPSDGGDEPEE